MDQIGAHGSITFNPCLNGETCVPLDDRSLRYFCARDAEFVGIECENTASKMIIRISSISTIPARVVHLRVC